MDKNKKTKTKKRVFGILIAVVVVGGFFLVNIIEDTNLKLLALFVSLAILIFVVSSYQEAITEEVIYNKANRSKKSQE